MRVVLHSLVSHYRRHPVQALFLLAGIIMANVLLVGTQVINAQARSSYAEGEVLLGAGPAGRVLPLAGTELFDERKYLQLRRSGYFEIAPLLRRFVLTGDGQSLELLGIDGLVMPGAVGADRQRIREGQAGTDYGSFSLPPFQLWGAPARLRQLGAAAGETIMLTNGATLPPATAVAGRSLGHRLLLDVGALQDLSDSRGQLSGILVFDMPPERLARFIAQLPADLRWVPASDQPDPAELTQSFHLNLAAMGLLSFVVGVFLIYNALAFSYTDRRVLIRRLRLAGVGRGELRIALLLELGVFLALGGLLGTLLGAWLAGFLIPGVGQTLAQLYGVYIQYPDGLVPGGWWPPLMMTALAGALCALFPLRRALRAPLLDRGEAGWSLAAAALRDRRLAIVGVVLLAIALLLSEFAATVVTALGGMACLLLGAALLLPLTLRLLLGLLQRLVPPRRAALGWLLADSRWLIGPASLALMAVTLALVANSGLNTMIGSFRAATDGWLAQRLTADLYLGETIDAQSLRDWLAREAPGVELAERHGTTLSLENANGATVRVQLVDLPDTPRFLNTLELFEAQPDALERFRAGEAVLISERAWRLDGFEPGQGVALCEGLPDLPIAGVYHDYGNTLSQFMLSAAQFQACAPGLGPSGQALFSSAGAEAGPDWPALTAGLIRDFALDESDVIDQRELRAIAMQVFDRTFAVTRALNLLTLLVAGIGIFCAISAIHHHRVAQQALLASLGLSRRLRGTLLLLQWGVLGLLAMVLVWPFGTLLAAYLAGVVTPIAFGWSFPLVLAWTPLLLLAGTAIACLILAVLLPSLRLLRSSPADLLRWQSV